MKMRSFLVALSLVLSGCFSSSKKAPSEPDRGVQPQDLSPSEWSALGRPSPSHQLLDLFVGVWDVTISTKDEKGQPMVSKGTSKSDWILGRRFIKEEFAGEAFGQRFEGIGIIGYDNAARRFSNVWVDSQSTTMAVAYGKYFEDQNRFEFEGEVYDPTLGRMKKSRSELQMQSANEYQFIMFEPDARGNEQEFLRINYKRR
jgi:hypothetical protein